MAGKLLDVGDHEAPRAECLTHAEERTIREMLVVDGVVLVLVDETGEMGELERRCSARCQEPLDAADEVIEIGDLGEDVVPDDQIGTCSLGGYSLGDCGSEEVDERGDASLLGARSDVGGGSIPMTGIPRETKCCRRYPSFDPSSTTRLALVKPSRSTIIDT